MRSRTAPLVRVPRTLPRILSSEEADRLVGALRTHRDRAMILAMLLAGLRRCEVLGLRFQDVQVADRRLVVTKGKGGHHRVVPAANRFLDALGEYLHEEQSACPGTRTRPALVQLSGKLLRRDLRPMPLGGGRAGVGGDGHQVRGCRPRDSPEGLARSRWFHWNSPLGRFRSRGRNPPKTIL